MGRGRGQSPSAAGASRHSRCGCACVQTPPWGRCTADRWASPRHGARVRSEVLQDWWNWVGIPDGAQRYAANAGKYVAPVKYSNVKKLKQRAKNKGKRVV